MDGETVALTKDEDDEDDEDNELEKEVEVNRNGNILCELLLGLFISCLSHSALWVGC